ncbi:MAG TPA: Rieske (2Fe-2S) protein [Kofleriaceae bacterium]|jgi:nitrite reductase/ring-hydroxylating ferredoxin subunit|nr:Rieske (2Fe-2S) protein [Kofleriaceae bacterium]
MRRNPELVDISRRGFCALAGCVGLAIAGCTDGDAPVVATGPLGDHPDAPEEPPDAPPGSPDARPGSPDARPGSPDAMMGTPDAGGGPTCSGTATDVGAASSFTTNSPKLFSTPRFYVVRDAGGLYAVSSRCTHEGAQNGVSSGKFLCPRHGAQFTFNGDIISGPVFTGLVHYAMCILSNGNVGVMTSQTVSQSTRLAV